MNSYGLIPVGDVEQQLNSVYEAGALNTYGLDAGYFITPVLKPSAGYYCQHRDQEEVDGFGVRGRLAYEMTSGVTGEVNISCDEAFDTRALADIKVRFGGASTTAQRKEVQQLPVINTLILILSNWDVRVHDCWSGGGPVLLGGFNAEGCDLFEPGCKDCFIFSQRIVGLIM